MNDRLELEHERTHLNSEQLLKKTNDMGRSRTMNERIKKTKDPMHLPKPPTLYD